ncbi:MAG: dihydrofolate reductase [Patescibacteria group bacterium]
MTKKKPTKSIIVAIAKENRAIGKNNQLLWDIPEDLKHFRETTSGHPVIMGERTFDSIGRPLPDRVNIVVSFKPDLKIDGCLVAHSLPEAYEMAAKYDQEEIFIIGGGMVYKSALSDMDKLYLTLVDGHFDADVFFPEYTDLFKVVSEKANNNGKHKFVFQELIRK